MEREELFQSFGFEVVGGIISGEFDSVTTSYDMDSTIYVDFKTKRVMIDEGDFSDTILIKGDFMEHEEKRIKKYNEALNQEIDDLSGLTELNNKTCKGGVK